MGNKSAAEIWKLKYADEIFLDFLKAMMLIIEIISNCVVNIFVGVFFFLDKNIVKIGIMPSKIYLFLFISFVIFPSISQLLFF